MDRHPALQDLSRDHFVALTRVVDVRRVAQGDRWAKPEGDARAAFLDLVRRVLPEHFREEEELLLPCLQAEERRGHADRLRREHGQLRARFGALTPTTPIEELWQTAQALQAHIRWEEDDLFGSLQRWLTDEELASLAAMDRRFRGQAGLPVGRRR